jgi:hypothetical protein
MFLQCRSQGRAKYVPNGPLLAGGLRPPCGPLSHEHGADGVWLYRRTRRGNLGRRTAATYSPAGPVVGPPPIVSRC